MNLQARALCNGKTLAFQAKDAGSIPAARSKSPCTAVRKCPENPCFLMIFCDIDVRIDTAAFHMIRQN
jgi:hypothetical protein